MANPQKEKGYTAIANEIMEALCKTRVPGEARQVLDTVLRKTYGFNKKEDWISLSQFCLSTGMKKPSIIRATNKLFSMKLINKKVNGETVMYSFNKNFDEWEPLTKKITFTKKQTEINKKVNKSFTKKLPTIVDNTKVDSTKVKDYVLFSDYARKEIKLSITVKGQAEELLKAYGLNEMKKTIDRAKKYWVRGHKKYRLFYYKKKWPRFYENISMFLDDYELEEKIEDEKKAFEENKWKAPKRTIEVCKPKHTIEQFYKAGKYANTYDHMDGVNGDRVVHDYHNYKIFKVPEDKI